VIGAAAAHDPGLHSPPREIAQTLKPKERQPSEAAASFTALSPNDQDNSFPIASG